MYAYIKQNVKAPRQTPSTYLCYQILSPEVITVSSMVL